MKKTRIKYYKKMGFNIEDRDFELYKNNVYGLTKKHKKTIIKELGWN